MTRKGDGEMAEFSGGTIPLEELLRKKRFARVFIGKVKGVSRMKKRGKRVLEQAVPTLRHYVLKQLTPTAPCFLPSGPL